MNSLLCFFLFPHKYFTVQVSFSLFFLSYLKTFTIKATFPFTRIFHDDSLWEMRDRSEDQKYAHHPYYGIRGIKKKLPNSYIAAGAVVFMIVGAIFHFFLAK